MNDCVKCINEKKNKCCQNEIQFFNSWLILVEFQNLNEFITSSFFLIFFKVDFMISVMFLRRRKNSINLQFK